ncbi:SDR family NAD(P)-dependent oxidoreductase [Maribacter sp. CXY002]|uniref:SDR family NAD(P)-dependent oxidoreductase n=1 Tax=Maribacter luteocoastalis TaxID=3407671 RepID=UPI003B66D542
MANSTTKKVFIITGANRGLGQAFVEELIKEPSNYIISISRSRTKDQALYDSSRFHLLEIDLSEENLDSKLSVLKNLIDRQEVYFINNASIILPIVKIENLTYEDIERTLAVNITAATLIVKFIIRHFKTNAHSFVNISSGAAHRAISNWSLYCSSKAFMDIFFKAAQVEYPNYRFYSIDPGVIDTAMQESIRDSDFPEVTNFQNLKKDGKLKSAATAASEILKTIL